MKLNFVVRESKVGKNGTAPLELSVTINGERKVFALDIMSLVLRCDFLSS